MPEKETAKRYFTVEQRGDGGFCGDARSGARHFREFDAAYAERCLAAARKSYASLVAHPENHRADQTGFSTGAYLTHDADDRLWATAELGGDRRDKLFARLRGAGTRARSRF